MTREDKVSLDIGPCLEIGRLVMDMVRDLRASSSDAVCRRHTLAFLDSEVQLFVAMGEAGRALTLTDEEIAMLQAFRRFRPHVRKNGQLFKWPTTNPEGEQPAKAKRKRRA